MIPHLGSLPDLKNLDPEEINLWWSAKLVTTHPAEEIENILIFFQDDKNEVNFEAAESPPEDPGLASLGIYNEPENKEQKQIKVDDSESKIEEAESILSLPLISPDGSNLVSINASTNSSNGTPY